MAKKSTSKTKDASEKDATPRKSKRATQSTENQEDLATPAKKKKTKAVKTSTSKEVDSIIDQINIIASKTTEHASDSAELINQNSSDNPKLDPKSSINGKEEVKKNDSERIDDLEVKIVETNQTLNEVKVQMSDLNENVLKLLSKFESNPQPARKSNTTANSNDEEAPLYVTEEGKASWVLVNSKRLKTAAESKEAHLFILRVFLGLAKTEEYYRRTITGNSKKDKVKKLKFNEDLMYEIFESVRVRYKTTSKQDLKLVSDSVRTKLDAFNNYVIFMKEGKEVPKIVKNKVADYDLKNTKDFDTYKSNPKLFEILDQTIDQQLKIKEENLETKCEKKSNGKVVDKKEDNVDETKKVNEINETEGEETEEEEEEKKKEDDGESSVDDEESSEDDNQHKKSPPKDDDA